jgi:hypothetical protein
MDPITAINLEFTRRVQADWSRAADGRSERATPAHGARAVERMLAIGAAGLTALGTWLKAHEQRVGRMIAQRRV